MAPVTDTKLTARKPSVSLRGCPICAGTDCEVLHSQKFVLSDGHPLSNGYDVVVCERCGFVYADTQVSQRDYDEFYARFSKYDDVRISTGAGGFPEDAQRLKEMAACIAKVIPDRRARLLDIGCAGGGLLKELRDLEYSRLCGLDPSPACIEATKTLCSAEGYVGSLSSLPANMGKFDGLILSHVFEHVQDLQQAMKSIGGLTRAGGVVYAEVPDAARYAECVLAPFQDFNTEHINHFSGQSLVNLFVRSGWIEKDRGRKTLQAAPGMPYPAVFGFFMKASVTMIAESWEKDVKLQSQISDYIAVSCEMMRSIDEQIARVLGESEEVIVWGTGQLAMKLLGETCLGQARIVAFVDGNPINQGKILRGIPILAPTQVRGSSAPIIVTSIIQGRAIAQVISNLNLPNSVVFLGN